MTEPVLRVVPAVPKALSVSELNRAVKALVEDRLGKVWVEGELQKINRSPSGHVYFDLKDDKEDARIACVLWKSAAQVTRARLVEGERVRLLGRPGVYVPRGQYQFTADLAEPAGAGAQAAALAALKKKLQALGSFEQARKRPLPRFPRAVGVVTSATGAAFGDICKVALQRWPIRIVLSPTLVQGLDAPGQIVRALYWIQKVPGVDVVILGRGGGAAEDLVAFNHERVAEAIFKCRLPVVSAVGHEVDNTLADLVADCRAPTPSGAAQLCVPDHAEETARLKALAQRLRSQARAKVNVLRVALSRRALRDPRRLLQERSQRLDELTRRLEDASLAKLSGPRGVLSRLEKSLERQHPRARLARDRQRLLGLSARLLPALEKALAKHSARLSGLDARLRAAPSRASERRRALLGTLAARLEALSPLAILARGYGVVLAEGRALTRARDAAPGEALTVLLHEGSLEVTVTASKEG
ncbi:MAG: exodeoxyribonuclease VII large subunit [Deltaproteobacteria bacterium]|nr:exodeoxyribonuclease VII large subunit [Deltaproteobacteria bacterium]